MSKLAAAVAVTTLALTVQLAHADVVEPTQEPAPAPVPEPRAHPTFENWTAEGETPSLDGARLAGEAALGTAFALGGGIGGAVIGAGIEVRNGCHDEFC